MAGIDLPWAKPTSTSRSRSDSTGARGLRTLPDLGGQSGGQFGRQHGFSAGHLLDGVDDLSATGIFRQVARGALLECPVDGRAIGGGGEQQYPGTEVVADHGVDHGQPVQLRHLVVDQGHGGAVLSDQLDGFPTVGCLGDHVDHAALGQATADAVPEERVIVGDQHRDARIAVAHVHPPPCPPSVMSTVCASRRIAGSRGIIVAFAALWARSAHSALQCKCGSCHRLGGRSDDSDTPPEESLNDVLVVEHGIRGAGLQVRLRGVLVVFALVTVLWEPPQSYAALCQSLAVAYLLWALAVAVWFRRNPSQLVSLGWLILTVDLLLFGTLNQLAGVSNRISWTAYILVAGFTMIPLLAAAQLRPRLGIVVGAAATALYLLSSVSARQWNGTPGTDGEPWSSVILRTFVVAGIALAAVLLTRLQRSRVADIGRLAAQRADLLDQLRQLADRQRRELAEALHDGALQYLLGARLDLEDARETGSPAAFDRIDEALTTSARLLRSTVSQLHPAVLEQAGLAQALRDLAADTQMRMSAGRPEPGRRERIDRAARRRPT